MVTGIRKRDGGKGEGRKDIGDGNGVEKVTNPPSLIDLICLTMEWQSLEACPTNKADRNSMDFAINHFMMKLLKTGNINIVEECMFYFNFQSVSMRIAARTVNFAMLLTYAKY